MPNTYGLKRLAQLIKDADPSMQSVDDAQLEAAWREKYGDQMPQDVLGTQTTQPTVSAEPGFMESIISRLSNAANMPTVKGIVGGIGGAALGGPLGAIAGATLGGMAGDINQQNAVDTSVMHQYDPLQTLFAGGEQGAWQAAGEGIGSALKSIGSRAYADAAGLTRPQVSRNFPTAAMEGLEGGRFSAPIITANGARRVYNRAAPVPSQLISDAMQSGVPGVTPHEIASRGMRPVLNEMRSGAALPVDERQSAIAFIKDFIEQQAKQHGGYVPPQEVSTGQTFNLGQPQTTTIPARVRPVPIPLDEVNLLKKGMQSRAANPLNAINAGKFPGLEGRVQQGASRGAQEALEVRVPGLKEANRRTQGLMGLNQSLNPSFRTPEELIKMGVDPTIAAAMTSAPTSNMRLWMDAGAVAGGGLIGGIPGAIAAPIAAHMATSPLTRRAVGAGLYTLGRVAPEITQAGRAALTLSPSQHDALRRALLEQ